MGIVFERNGKLRLTVVLVPTDGRLFFILSGLQVVGRAASLKKKLSMRNSVRRTSKLQKPFKNVPPQTAQRSWKIGLRHLIADLAQAGWALEPLDENLVHSRL